MIERRFDFKQFVLGLCYGKEETCTRAQIRNYVTERIDAFSLVIDDKLHGKSDVGHKHVKADVSDLKTVTKDESGLMSPALLSKLDGIDVGANKITVDNKLNGNSENPVQNKVIVNEFYTKEKIIELLNNIQTGHGKLLSIYVDEATGDLIVEDDGFDYYTSDEVDEKFTVTVNKQSTPDSGFLSTYVIKQGGNALSSKINIPKDFLVKSASIKICSANNNPVSGFSKGDKYIDFVVNTRDGSANDEHLYLLVSELIDVYTADESTLTVNNNQFSVKSVPADKVNGLSRVAFSGSFGDLIDPPDIPFNIGSRVEALEFNEHFTDWLLQRVIENQLETKLTKYGDDAYSLEEALADYYELEYPIEDNIWRHSRGHLGLFVYDDGREVLYYCQLNRGTGEVFIKLLNINPASNIEMNVNFDDGTIKTYKLYGEEV